MIHVECKSYPRNIFAGLVMVQLNQIETIDPILELNAPPAVNRAPSNAGAEALPVLLEQQLASTYGGSARLVPVVRDSREHTIVRRAMAESFNGDRVLCIRSIERVENRVLQRSFAAYTPRIGDSSVTFKLHGTKKESADSICLQGFLLPTDVNDCGMCKSCCSICCPQRYRFTALANAEVSSMSRSQIVSGPTPSRRSPGRNSSSSEAASTLRRTPAKRTFLRARRRRCFCALSSVATYSHSRTLAQPTHPSLS
jgi:hypothetical protein